MRVTTIHGPRDIRLEERPVPSIEAPTDAIIKVTAGCICGSDLWPYRGENDITPGDTIGHEMIGVVEEVGSEVTSFRPGDFVIAPFCHSDNTCPNCLAGVTSACVNFGITTGGQGEYAKVTQAEGSLVLGASRDDGMPDPDMLPALLTLSDVLPTGWHCAVAAARAAGGHRRGRGRRSRRAVRRARGGADGCRAGHRDVAACRPPGARPQVRRHPHRGGAWEGGSRPDQGAHLRCRRGRRARVRGHRRFDAAGVRMCPPRLDRRLRRRPARCRAAGVADVRQEHRARRRDRSGAAPTCPPCSSWSPPVPSTPGPSST